MQSHALNRLALSAAEWDETHESWQHRIPFDAPTEHRDFLSREVKAGNARLLDITDKGTRVGMLVYRIEEAAGREFVVMSVFADAIAGRDLTAEIIASVDSIARGLNCRSVRFHTLRPGLLKKSLTHGYRVAEIVLRKNVQ